MRSIRKFAYAAVLSLSIFTLQPSSAAAEEHERRSEIRLHRGTP